MVRSARNDVETAGRLEPTVRPVVVSNDRFPPAAWVGVGVGFFIIC